MPARPAPSRRDLGVFKNVSQTLGALRIPPQDTPTMPQMGAQGKQAGPAKGKPR